MDGTCIETSPVNRVTGHSEKFNFDPQGRSINQSALSVDTSGNILDKDFRAEESRTFPASRQTEENRQSKLDRLIVDFINSSDSNDRKQSQATTQPESEVFQDRTGNQGAGFREYGSLEEKTESQAEVSEEQKGERLMSLLVDGGAKKTPHDTSLSSKCRSNPQMPCYSAGKSSNRSFENEGKKAYTPAQSEAEYRYAHLKGSHIKVGSAISDKEKKGYTPLGSPVLDAPAHYKSDDAKRLSLCDYANSSGEPNTSHYWLKRPPPAFKGVNFSKDVFGKKKSVSGNAKHPPRRRHEVSSYDPSDLPRMFKKREPGSGREKDPQSPIVKGDLRNSSGKIRSLKQ